MLINRGDIYWIQFSDESHSAIAHPHVVVQDNVFNHSRIETTIVCALTTNMKHLNMPGNILLEPGEANLPKQSIIEVAKVSAVDKTQLGDYIGSLDEKRVEQILNGMRFLQRSFFS